MMDHGRAAPRREAAANRSASPCCGRMHSLCNGLWAYREVEWWRARVLETGCVARDKAQLQRRGGGVDGWTRHGSCVGRSSAAVAVAKWVKMPSNNCT
jgi:hypothetical protein